MNLPLYSCSERVTTRPDVDQLIAEGSPIAIGVSGGKDSSAVALATNMHLDRLGHAGPRVLIHSDLGRTEWRASLPMCEQLADRLGLELITVRRSAGDMLARWQTRWANSLVRYVGLSCVKLILPWSTAKMRFCTAELKRDVICRELVRRFPGRTIISVNGIRRQESRDRAKAPVIQPQVKLQSKKWRTSGLDWHPIIDWTLDDVFSFLRKHDIPLHEAYTKYGSSRVSCAFCILGSKADLRAASTSDDNADLYRLMVDLEVQSTFGFQDSGWLADVAPHLLAEETRGRVVLAKERAARRVAIESRIPKHLLYTKGWPTCIPSASEADLMSGVRRDVSEVMNLKVEHTTAASVLDRYRELMALMKSKTRRAS